MPLEQNLLSAVEEKLAKDLLDYKVNKICQLKSKQAKLKKDIEKLNESITNIDKEIEDTSNLENVPYDNSGCWTVPNGYGGLTIAGSYSTTCASSN